MYAGSDRARQVGMIEIGELREPLRLGEKALHRVGIGSVPAQELEDDADALRILGQPGVGEAAGAELVNQLVAGDLRVLQRRGRLGMREALALVADGLAGDQRR